MNKARFLASTAVILGMVSPVFAQQAGGRNTATSGANTFESMSAPRYSPGAAPTAPSGDNLGNHTAGQNLNMSNFGIYNLRDMDTAVPRPDQAANKRYVDEVAAATALAARDNLGNHVATQTLNMAGFAVNNIPAPTGPTQAANRAYVDSAIIAGRDNLGNHTATMNINLDGRRIVGLSAPSLNTDGANKAYVDAAVLAGRDNLGNHTATMILNLATFRITNVGTPTAPTDAVNKSYVDDINSGVSTNISDLRNRVIDTGTGLEGGGNLTADRIISFDTSWGDGRYALTTRQISTGSGLTGGGSLGSDRTLSVDSTVVRTTGNQTLAGVKTFTSAPSLSNNRLTSVGTPTAASDAATKGYVDTQISAIPSAPTYSAGSGLTLTGTTFSTDNTVVRTSGDQQLAGRKTFTSEIYARNINGFRIGNGINGASVIFRNDSNFFQMMPTAEGDFLGSWGTLRPFGFSTINGRVTMQNGATISSGLAVANGASVAGGLTVTSGGAAITGGISAQNSRITLVGNPTTDTDAANKAYVDARVASSVTSYTAGSGLTLSGTSFSVDATVVRTTGAQSLAGIKTFTENLRANSGALIGGGLTVSSGGATITGGISAQGGRVSNVGAPTNAADATNKAYVDALVAANPDTDTTYTAGSGLTLTGTSFSADATVVRTTGPQTLAGSKTFTDEIVARAPNGLRIGSAAGAAAMLIRNDGVDSYMLLTDAGNFGGGFNGMRPFTIRNATGLVTMANGVSVSNGLTVSGGISAQNSRITLVAAPTANTDAANKAYVDAQMAAAGTTYTAGSGLTLTGTAFSADATVVRTTGSQTVGGVKTFSNEILATAGTALRIGSNAAAPGVLVRNDGTSFSFLLTDAGNFGGGWNGLRPFAVNTSTGRVSMNNGVTVQSGLTVSTGGASITGGISAQNGRITMVATPTVNTDAANKAYVDAQVAAAGTNYIAGSGLTLTGSTFSADATVVRTTGAQTLAGVKTFTDEVNARAVAGLRIGNDTSAPALILRNGGVNSFLLLTNAGDYAGGPNALRPLSIANATGRVTIGNGANLNGGVNVTGGASIAGGISAQNSAITLVAAPVAATDAANKAYVDAQVALAGAYTAGSGLTLTGTQFSADATVLRTMGAQAVSGEKTFESETHFSSTTQLRLRNGTSGRGALLRNDGVNTYFLLTDDGVAATGGWNDLRPLTINNTDGSVAFGNSVYSNAYYYFSDRNLKKDIETVDAQSGIDMVRALNPVSYRWKDTDKAALGLIAQEAEAVIPSAVTTNEAGVKAVDYIQVIAPMLAAIQELDARVQVLEAALAAE